MEAQQLNLQLLEGGITKQKLSTQKDKTTKTIPVLEVGQKLAELISNQEPISTKVLSEIMTAAYRGTDAQGKWIWKEAYEALELGTVLYLRDRGIKYLVESPYQALQNLIEWQSKFPTHTKRSEDTYNYQQFSTSLPMSFLVAQAAGITRKDIVLEPSAGNGMLAIWAHLAKAKLILNELHQQRQQNLKALFPQAAITGFNGE